MTTSIVERAPEVVDPIPPARRKAPRPLPPPVRFADAAHRARTLRDAERARAIVLAPQHVQPGALARALDTEMETLLALRGAMPPGVPADADYSEVVDDQVARAVTLPVRGICLALPKLLGSSNANLLNDEDGKAVLAWMAAARTEKRLRLVVLVDDSDRELDLRAPTRLEHLVQGASARTCDDASSLALSFTTPTPAPASVDEPSEACPLPSDVTASAAPSEAAMPEMSLPSLDVPEMTVMAESPPPIADTMQPPPPPPGVVFEPELELDEEALSLAGALLDGALSGLPSPVANGPSLRSHKRAPRVASAEEERAHAERASRLVHMATHRNYSLDLDAARGPKPVAVVERLFVQRYLPLLAATARGETDDAVRTIVEEWQKSFAESYEAAYEAIRLTGKRPTMVMDAPDVAHRVARLASARSVKLILVDSMSYDLAERVEKRVGAALVKRAVLVEKTVLWAALPTTTPTQSHLLARGVEGFRDQPPPSSEPDIARGRSVSTLRRERLGGREVIKLDLIEARLRGQGPAYEERLDAIADEVAQILVKLLDSLPPRTLAFIFGDHGFTLAAGSNGFATGASSQGGSTPEEVLVAGHGWLVDAVQ